MLIARATEGCFASAWDRRRASASSAAITDSVSAGTVGSRSKSRKVATDSASGSRRCRGSKSKRARGANSAAPTSSTAMPIQIARTRV